MTGAGETKDAAADKSEPIEPTSSASPTSPADTPAPPPPVAPPAIPPGGNLSPAVVRDRLRLNSPELVENIYELAKAQVAYETGRQGRLDSKATSLLTASGLSVTVAFSFGTTLITYGSRFDGVVIVAYAAAVSLGLTAAILAVAALKVAGTYTTVSDHAVFDAGELPRANWPTWEGDEAVEIAERLRFGVMRYQKHLIAHLWEIYRANAAQNEIKATRIKYGQYVFVAFLIALLACAGLVFRVVSTNERQPSTARPTESTASTQASSGVVRPVGADHEGSAVGSANPKGRDRRGASAGPSGHPPGDATAARGAAATSSAAPPAASTEEASEVNGP